MSDRGGKDARPNDRSNEKLDVNKVFGGELMERYFKHQAVMNYVHGYEDKPKKPNGK